MYRNISSNYIGAQFVSQWGSKIIQIYALQKRKIRKIIQKPSSEYLRKANSLLQSRLQDEAT